MNESEFKRIKDHFDNISTEQFLQNLEDCGYGDTIVKVKKVPMKDEKTGKVYYLDWQYIGKCGI